MGGLASHSTKNNNNNKIKVKHYNLIGGKFDLQLLPLMNDLPSPNLLDSIKFYVKLFVKAKSPFSLSKN